VEETQRPAEETEPAAEAPERTADQAEPAAQEIKPTADEAGGTGTASGEAWKSRPRVWVKCHSGRMFAQPSDQLLSELIDAVEEGTEEFLIAENLTDPTGHTYFQTILDDDRRFIVEHRDGDADRHFRALTPDKALVHAAMAGWAAGRPGWHDQLDWGPLTLN
jgi:hypothetical protein